MAVLTAFLQRRVEVVARWSRDFPPRQKRKAPCIAVWCSKRRPPKCSAFSAALAGKSSTPEAVCDAGSSIAILAKTSRSGLGNSWVGHARLLLNTLTRVHGSADDSICDPADLSRRPFVLF